MHLLEHSLLRISERGGELFLATKLLQLQSELLWQALLDHDGTASIFDRQYRAVLTMAMVNLLHYGGEFDIESITGFALD